MFVYDCSACCIFLLHTVIRMAFHITAVRIILIYSLGSSRSRSVYVEKSLPLWCNPRLSYAFISGNITPSTERLPVSVAATHWICKTASRCIYERQTPLLSSFILTYLMKSFLLNYIWGRRYFIFFRKKEALDLSG